MMDQTRMPIVPASQRNKSAPFVGETEFIDPDNESEHVKIYIHMAQVEFLDDKLETDFGSHNNEQRSFVEVLKSLVLQYDSEELQRRVNANNGELSVKLDGTEVTLKRGTHFFFNKKDRSAAQ